MRFYSKLIIIFAAITILFNSCKNELNILAPYKETVSVYALLNPTAARQYVRINKIYLGEGNAYTMATVNDSINYKQGVLKVSLTRSFNGSAANTTVGNPTKMEIILNDTVIQTEPGPFNQNQRLWFTNDRLYATGEYHLKIQNTQTGNEFTSKALMIDSILQPGTIQPLGSPFYPVPYSPSNPSWYYLDLSVTTLQRKIKFFSMPNARDYSAIMRLNYVDYLTNGDSIQRTLDYNFSNMSSLTLDGGEEIIFNYTSSEYFNFIYNEISSKTESASVLNRRVVNIDFIITAGNQDFADFLRISAPSSSVAQDKPAYTNIDGGGYGIFACRSTYYKRKHLANATIDHMASKKPLCDLRFKNSFGVVSSTCN